MHENRSPLFDLLVSASNIILSKTVAAPFEKSKLLLQCQSTANRYLVNPRPRYTGLFNVLVRVPEEQGLMALWRGNLLQFARYFPTQAFNFAFRDFFRNLFGRANPRTDYFRFFIQNLLSGGAAGAASLLFVYPLDLAHTKIAVDTGVDGDLKHPRKYYGFFDVCKKVVSTSGFTSLFAGFNISIIGIILYRGLYFGLYDSMAPSVRNKGFLHKFLMAQFVTIFAGLASYPCDTIRRRLMIQAGEKVQIYNGTLDCIKKTIQEEGVLALFDGALQNVVRSFVGALVLVIYDSVSQNFTS